MKNRIREFLKATPFRPFVITMADGSRHYIDHPDFVLAAPETPQVIIETLDNNVIYLSVLLITSVEHAPVKRSKLKKPSQVKP